MSKLNKIIPILISGFVLISALFLPFILFKIYDNRLLGKVYTERFMGLAPAKSDKLDISSRLEIICGYGRKESIVLTDKNESENLNMDEGILIRTVLEEISKMQEIGAFPYIDLQEDAFKLTMSISKTYTDISSSGKYVKLNFLNFSSSKYKLHILKDSETNKIYQYEIISTETLGALDIPIIAKNLSDYLGIQLANVSYQGEYPVRFVTEDREIFYEISEFNNGLFVKISYI